MSICIMFIFAQMERSAVSYLYYLQTESTDSDKTKNIIENKNKKNFHTFPQRETSL